MQLITPSNSLSARSDDYAGGLTTTGVQDKTSHPTEACPLCGKGGSIFDPEKSELICSCCGMVIYESSELVSEIDGLDSENNSRSIPAGVGAYQSHALYDGKPSTVISGSNSDAHGSSFTLEQRVKAYRLRKWNNISNLDTSYNRNLKNASSLLKIIQDKLSLTDALMEKSSYYYRKAFEKRLIKGRSIVAFIVASTYLSCRELKINRSLDEIATAVNTDSLFAGKRYRKLLRHLKLKSSPMDCAMHLLKIAKNSTISEKSCRIGLEVLRSVKKNHVSYGKAPDAIAAAALYFVCIKEGEKISLQRIASAAGISTVTLRKRIADVQTSVSLDNSNRPTVLN